MTTLHHPSGIIRPGAILAPYPGALPSLVLSEREANVAGLVEGQVVHVPEMELDPGPPPTWKRIAMVVRIRQYMPPPPTPSPPPMPRRQVGELVTASDRRYQVGLDGELRRVTPKPASKRERRKARARGASR